MMNVVVSPSRPCLTSTDLIIDLNTMDNSLLALDESDSSSDEFQEKTLTFVSHRSSIEVFKGKSNYHQVTKNPVDDSMHTQATAMTTGTYLSEPKSTKRVSFGSLTIHEHGVELGGSGVPRAGPSISLGWRRDSSTTVDSVEQYEDSRPCTPRKGIEMLLPKKQRVDMMLASGYTFNQIKLASEEIETLRKQRTKTVQQLSLKDRTKSTLKKLAVWRKSE